MTDTTPVNTSSGALFLDAASIDLGDIDMSSLNRIAHPLFRFPSTTPVQLGSRKQDAWCVIVNKVALGREFFQCRPDLRLVCICASGTDNVDLEAARDHNVAVVNCQGYSTDTVAQHTLMLMLALLRSFPQYHAGVGSGAWSRSPLFCLLDHPIRETQGLSLGIVGFGQIGRKVGELAAAFGVDVVVAERPGCFPRSGRRAFDEVLSTCDIVSLHCPLTAATEHLINRRVLRMMRSDALLINTARGGLIDEVALFEALSSGWIAGAAIDALSVEPPPSHQPLIQKSLPNLIVTPHCAWASGAARQRAIDQTAENIAQWLQGKRCERPTRVF